MEEIVPLLLLFLLAAPRTSDACECEPQEEGTIPAAAVVPLNGSWAIPCDARVFIDAETSAPFSVGGTEPASAPEAGWVWSSVRLFLGETEIPMALEKEMPRHVFQFKPARRLQPDSEYTVETVARCWRRVSGAPMDCKDAPPQRTVFRTGPCSDESAGRNSAPEILDFQVTPPSKPGRGECSNGSASVKGRLRSGVEEGVWSGIFLLHYYDEGGTTQPAGSLFPSSLQTDPSEKQGWQLPSAFRAGGGSICNRGPEKLLLPPSGRCIKVAVQTVSWNGTLSAPGETQWFVFPTEDPDNCPPDGCTDEPSCPFEVLGPGSSFLGLIQEPWFLLLGGVFFALTITLVAAVVMARRRRRGQAK